jgi:hypothetical protein
MCLPISLTSLTELGRCHAKKIHTNICYVQHIGENSPHHTGITVLLVGFISQ